MPKYSLLAALLAAGCPRVPAAMAEQYSHEEYFEHYEGTKTCLDCHREAAETFFHSQHYQWRGDTPQIVNADAASRWGKLNTINDFCTNPAQNWIGLVHNSRGDVLSKGCSKCHAGLRHAARAHAHRGAAREHRLPDLPRVRLPARPLHQRGRLPRVEADPLEEPGGPRLVSKRISLPKREMCLRCHSASGGGPNFKRGDLEYELAKTDRSYDVHMGDDGGDLSCIDCHAGEDHRIRGRGVDLVGTDSPDNLLSCQGECHDAASVHEAEILNHHTRRVNCTVCHVSTFARDEATDMVRDWSTPKYYPEDDRYTATITMQKDVVPVYAWFNGTTKAQLPQQPAISLADGTVGMMVPEGSREDPKSKIFAFKLHKGKMPMLDEQTWIIPILVEHFFADGDIDSAVKHATEEAYGIKGAAYSWVDTVRYMGIFHSVQPKEQAVACLECHSPGGRMDWKALGYPGDPMLSLIQASR